RVNWGIEGKRHRSRKDNPAMIRLPRHWLAPCLSLVTAAALGIPVHGQSDLIKEAKQRQEIATQVAESEMKEAVRKANGLGKAEAIALLKKTIDKIEGNDEINPTRKTSMIRSLQDRVRITELSAKAAGESTTSPKASARKSEYDKQLAEIEKIRDTMKEI